MCSGINLNMEVLVPTTVKMVASDKNDTIIATDPNTLAPKRRAIRILNNMANAVDTIWAPNAHTEPLNISTKFLSDTNSDHFIFIF